VIGEGRGVEGREMILSMMKGVKIRRRSNEFVEDINLPSVPVCTHRERKPDSIFHELQSRSMF